MESFYYVIIYASVLWLPHENCDDVERQISKFFDEYDEYQGRTQGGVAKESNRISATFYDLWGFKNNTLKNWLEKVRDLQWRDREGRQPEWTPKLLCDQWKFTDEDDLPVDDRVEHVQAKVRRQGKRIQEINTLDGAREGHDAAPPKHESGSLNGESKCSSKRSAEEARFEERSDASKRSCRLVSEKVV